MSVRWSVRRSVRRSVCPSVGHTRVETMKKCCFWPKLPSVRAKLHLMPCIRPCYPADGTSVDLKSIMSNASRYLWDSKSISLADLTRKWKRFNLIQLPLMPSDYQEMIDYQSHGKKLDLSRPKLFVIVYSGIWANPQAWTRLEVHVVPDADFLRRLKRPRHQRCCITFNRQQW